MKTLHLVLAGKWYDLIDCGAKTSEYRAPKPYWNKRFMSRADYLNGLDPVAFGYPCKYKYESVVFHRGYTKTIMKFSIVSIHITKKTNDLGLDACWEIKLGQRLA